MADLKALTKESLELARAHQDRTHVWDAIAFEVVRDPVKALKFLADCADGEFVTVGEVLEEVAEQVGVSFIEKVEALAAMRPGIDISAELCAAKEIIQSEW